jgi:signal transduction histidine kinase
MSSAKKTVLVVDDNPLNRELLRRTLRGHYTTVEAEDGLKALAILEHEPIDVIVCDVLMPNLDGYGLCREVHRRSELVKVFFVLYTAANFTAKDEKIGLECGADRFIKKEGNPKVILQAVDELFLTERERRSEFPGPTDNLAPQSEMKSYDALLIQQMEENTIEIEKARAELRDMNELLTQRVGERTAELEIANKRLEGLNDELELRVAARTEELARSNGDLAQFASAASHDLQEPLRAVAGCIQVFERKYRGKLDDKADELIQMIVSGSARMKALIDGILAYSQASEDETLEMTDTGAVLRFLLADLNVAITESKTEIVSTELPPLRFVKAQFEQVLKNLLSNAIKYRKAPGQKIYIRAGRQDDGWIFSVTDSGIGFEQQYAQKVFGVFQRLHGHDRYPGTGIGLAIGKKIVERRGGKIWVESKPNHGSTFFFSVPDAVPIRHA